MIYMIKNKKESIWILVFVFSGIILASIYCMLNKKMITDIYLPAGLWNDEAFYYKQVEGMVKYGIPQGYFGYAETSAKYLTLGAWSPAILVPYVIWGKAFGWTLLSPIYCNLFLFTFSLLLFYLWVRPDKRQMMTFIMLLTCSPMVIRYIISGMTEAFFFSGAIIMCGILYKLNKEGKSFLFIVISYLLIGYFTLARPYIIIILLVPFWFCRKQYFNKSGWVLLGTVFYASIVMGMYMWLSKYLCAPFFKPLISSDVIDNFNQGIIHGIVGLFTKYFLGWKEIIGYCADAFTGADAGEYYLYFLAANFIMLFLYLKDRKNYILLYTLFCNFVIISAIIMLYATRQGGRHLLMLHVWNIMIISMQKNIWGKSFFTAFLVLILLVVPKNSYTYTIPYGDQTTINENLKIKEELQAVLHLEQDVGWNNTIAWIVDGEYGINYFLPSGFGININYDGIGYEEIKSKYILVKEEKDTNSLVKEKAEKIWQYNDYILYKKR